MPTNAVPLADLPDNLPSGAPVPPGDMPGVQDPSTEGFGKSAGDTFLQGVNPLNWAKGIIHTIGAGPEEFVKAHVENTSDNMKSVAKSIASGDYKAAAAKLLIAGGHFGNANAQIDAGNYAGAAGSIVGTAGAAVAPMAAGGALKALSGASEGAATSIAANALDTTPEAAGAALKTPGVLPYGRISDAGLARLQGALDDLGQQESVAAKGAPGTVDLAPKVTAELDKLKAKAQQQALPDKDVATIESAKQEFLKNNPGPISVEDAVNLKKGTYQQLPGKYNGGPQNFGVQAEQTIARVAKEETQAAFPELKDINSAQSKLLDLEGDYSKALDKSRLEILDTFAKKGLTSGLANLIQKTLMNPSTRTRLAMAIYTGGKSRGMTFGQALAKVGTYADTVSQAVPQDQPSQ